MKKYISTLLISCMVLPVFAFASDRQDAFEEVQHQIFTAYYLGNIDVVRELFLVLLEIIALDNQGGYASGSRHLEVETLGARDIDEDEAQLRAEIDWNDADEAYVWFEYGTDDDELEYETSRERVDDRDDDVVEIEIRDLRDDEKYYFRAVAEDRDTQKLYEGDIEYFYTRDGDSDDDEEPDVDTEDADRVTEDGAELSGSVDMNDYENGTVFFVWGEDEDQVEDIEDEYSEYRDIDEDGDDLQKVRLDSDLDGSAEYRLDLYGLDDGTRYYYSLCVEYDEDRGDEVIICGSVEDFRTDN